MHCERDNMAVCASGQMRQEKSKALGSHSLEEPLGISENLSLVFESKIITCFQLPCSPTCRSLSTAPRPSSGTERLLPPTQSWVSVSAVLQSALNNLHEMTESAWIRNWEILCKHNRSSGNAKEIQKGKEALPSQPLCLNTPRFLVRIVVFTSPTSKLLHGAAGPKQLQYSSTKPWQQEHDCGFPHHWEQTRWCFDQDIEVPLKSRREVVDQSLI